MLQYCTSSFFKKVCTKYYELNKMVLKLYLTFNGGTMHFSSHPQTWLEKKEFRNDMCVHWGCVRVREGKCVCVSKQKGGCVSAWVALETRKSVCKFV